MPNLRWNALSQERKQMKLKKGQKVVVDLSVLECPECGESKYLGAGKFGFKTLDDFVEMGSAAWCSGCDWRGTCQDLVDHANQEPDPDQGWFDEVPTYQLRVISNVFASIDDMNDEENAVFIAAELELDRRARGKAIKGVVETFVCPTCEGMGKAPR